MNFALLPLLTFGAVVAAIGGVYSILSDLYLRDRSRVNQRIDDEFRKKKRERAGKAMLFKDLNQRGHGDRPPAGGPAEPQGAVRGHGRAVRAGSDSPEAALDRRRRRTCRGSPGGPARRSVVVGSAGALLGLTPPLLYVQMKRKQRTEKLLSQLPDAFDLMARIVRARANNVPGSPVGCR